MSKESREETVTVECQGVDPDDVEKADAAWSELMNNADSICGQLTMAGRLFQLASVFIKHVRGEDILDQGFEMSKESEFDQVFNCSQPN